jgi:hypothetical protein
VIDEWFDLEGSYATLAVPDRVLVGYEDISELDEGIRADYYRTYGKSFVGMMRVCGGADMDDGFVIQFFVDHDGVLRMLVLRQPNRAGEYMVFKMGEFGISPENPPKMDSRKLVRRVDLQKPYHNIVEAQGLQAAAQESKPFNKKDFLDSAIRALKDQGVLELATYLDQAATDATGSTEILAELNGGVFWGPDTVIDAQMKDGGPVLKAIRQAISIIAVKLVEQCEFSIAMKDIVKACLPFDKKDMEIKVRESNWDLLLAEHDRQVEQIQKAILHLRKAAKGPVPQVDPRTGEARGVNWIMTSDLKPFARMAKQLKGTWGSAHIRAAGAAKEKEIKDRVKRQTLKEIEDMPERLRHRLIRAIAQVAYLNPLDITIDQEIDGVITRIPHPENGTASDGILWFPEMAKHTLAAFQSVGAAYKVEFQETEDLTLVDFVQEEWTTDEVYSLRFSSVWLGVLNMLRRKRGLEPFYSITEEARAIRDGKYDRTDSDGKAAPDSYYALLHTAQIPWTGMRIRLNQSHEYWVDFEGDPKGSIKLGERGEGVADTLFLRPGIYEILHHRVYEASECRLEFFVTPVEFFEEGQDEDDDEIDVAAFAAKHGIDLSSTTHSSSGDDYSFEL